MPGAPLPDFRDTPLDGALALSEGDVPDRLAAIGEIRHLLNRLVQAAETAFAVIDNAGAGGAGSGHRRAERIDPKLGVIT